jgi:putative hydrolase of the HAD superfamily
MLKAVSFDLWETLITEAAEEARAQERLRFTRIEEILRARGHGALAGRIEHAYRALWQRCLQLYWSVDRDVPCRRQIEHFLEELGLDPASFDEATLAAIEDAYATAALEILPHAVDGAHETLAGLRERGLRIGLISNTGRTPGSVLRGVLDRLGLAASIDVMLFSNEHGECKPQASIFEKLREGLGVDYAEMAFVGDNLYVDVHGAQRCGMRGIHFVPAVRGLAVAPHFEHGLEIVPDAEIARLPELLEVLRPMM